VVKITSGINSIESTLEFTSLTFVG
jgi:hypothetical protein